MQLWKSKKRSFFVRVSSKLFHQKKYINDSTGDDNTWGKIDIDKPLVTNEIGKCYLFEAICIPITLTDEHVTLGWSRPSGWRKERLLGQEYVCLWWLRFKCWLEQPGFAIE